MSRDEAIEEAVKRNVDLVEIAPNASPPVAKLIDFKKFLYQQKKKKREEKRNTSKGETKEIRLGLFISEHDLETKLRKAREFFADGNKVKITLVFKGRQLGYKNLGEELLQKVLEKLKEEAKVEREIKMEGRQMTVLLSSIKH
jgi:translation initiation factor IF-3